MRRWHLTLLAAVAALGLQACDQSPPQTTVQAPRASLPDDTVLHGTDSANAPQAAATPPTGATPPVAATPPAENASASEVAAAPPAASESPAAQTSAMGAPPEANAQQPSAAAAPGQAPGGQGTAAMTEMWQAFPPAGSGGASSAAQPAGTSGTAPQKVSAADLPAVRNPGDPQGARLLAQRPLAVPVAGIVPTALADNYEQSRGSRPHEAIDILAPAGTPVVAVDDGRIAKLFTSKPGGLTVYQYDPQSQLAYYYAHLQGYAQGLREGLDVRRGDLIGYVGTTGNADRKTPHLHFAVFRLGTPPKWWQGEAVNPYPALSRARPAQLAQR
ncbi:M23 family metallopeptidase [Ramlibacter sp. AN1133]|uniref:M23 family metallopeptidase n=1 Tax=Ramlibacter sp. AN1133 TaxID=3133429 RepID=UPI0030C051F3